MNDLGKNACPGDTTRVTQQMISREREREREREMMLFIGKPKGRSIMIFNATNPLRKTQQMMSRSQNLPFSLQVVLVLTTLRGGMTMLIGLQPRSRVFLRKSFLGQATGWGLDAVAINEALKIVYILEFKRSTDKDKGFLEVKDAEANEQHKSIIGALKAASPELEFEQINFAVGNRGTVVESDFYTKLKNLDIQEGKKDKLFADHVTQVCKAHYRVIVSSSSRCKEV